MPYLSEGQLAVFRAANEHDARPVRVASLMTAAPLGARADFIFVSLTDWTTYSELHWFFAAREPSGEIDLRLQEGLEWTGRDNLGNHYEGANLGGGGNSPNWKAHTMLVPAVSADASLLTIQCTSPLDGSDLLTELPLGTRRKPN